MLASPWALSGGLSQACPADVSLGPSLPPGHFPIAPSSEADVLFGSSGVKGPRSLFSRACPPEKQAQPPHRQEWGKWRSQLESPGAAGGTDARRPLLQVDVRSRNGRLRARLACCPPHWEVAELSSFRPPWRRAFQGPCARPLLSALGVGRASRPVREPCRHSLSLSPTSPFSSGPGAG